MFIRMAVTADNRESLAKAIEILLAGITRPSRAPNHPQQPDLTAGITITSQLENGRDS
jgi:hypothetical protein